MGKRTPVVCPKIRGNKNAFVISKVTVGLPLSIYRWKVLPEQNICKNISILLLNLKRMKNMPFCPKGPAVCKISQRIILKWGNSKQEKFSNYLISKESFVSFKSYICSFQLIIVFSQNSQKGPFLSPVVHSSNITTWKWLYIRNNQIQPIAIICRPSNARRCLKLQLHDAIYRLRFYSNLLTHILSLSNSNNDVE